MNVQVPWYTIGRKLIKDFSIAEMETFELVLDVFSNFPRALLTLISDHSLYRNTNKKHALFPLSPSILHFHALAPFNLISGTYAKIEPNMSLFGYVLSPPPTQSAP